LLLFDDELSDAPRERSRLRRWSRTAGGNSRLAEAMYQLLSGAHYRTSPLDLRRMMDAPGQHFLRPHGRRGRALWLVEEGGLVPN
jgi:tRNA(Met) cytidine acetyltransferase